MLQNDPATAKSKQIRSQVRKRFQEVQEKMRSDLSSKPVALADLEKMMEALRKEILTTKFLVLGEEMFEGSSPGEAKRKALLDYLDEELKVLSEQKALLKELMGSD